MVIGLYGILYWHVARDPEHGFLIAAVGLVGKVIGPIGLAQLLFTGAWRPRTFILCVTNDFIWWIPFLMYLRDCAMWGGFSNPPGGSGFDSPGAG